jgi:hypothetical protein
MSSSNSITFHGSGATPARQAESAGPEQAQVGQKRLCLQEGVPLRQVSAPHQTASAAGQCSALRSSPPAPVVESTLDAAAAPPLLRQLMEKYKVAQTVKNYKQLSNSYTSFFSKKRSLENDIEMMWNAFFGPEAAQGVIGVNISDPVIRAQLEKAYLDLNWLQNLKEIPTAKLAKYPTGLMDIKKHSKRALHIAVLVFSATKKNGLGEKQILDLNLDKDIDVARKRQVVLDPCDQDFIFKIAESQAVGDDLNEFSATLMVEIFNFNYMRDTDQSRFAKEKLLSSFPAEVRSALEAQPSLTLTAVLTLFAKLNSKYFESLCNQMMGKFTFDRGLVRTAWHELKSKVQLLQELGAMQARSLASDAPSRSAPAAAVTAQPAGCVAVGQQAVDQLAASASVAVQLNEDQILPAPLPPQVGQKRLRNGQSVSPQPLVGASGQFAHVERRPDQPPASGERRGGAASRAAPSSGAGAGVVQAPARGSGPGPGAAVSLPVALLMQSGRGAASLGVSGDVAELEARPTPPQPPPATVGTWGDQAAQAQAHAPSAWVSAALNASMKGPLLPFIGPRNLDTLASEVAGEHQDASIASFDEAFSQFDDEAWDEALRFMPSLGADEPDAAAAYLNDPKGAEPPG